MRDLTHVHFATRAHQLAPGNLDLRIWLLSSGAEAILSTYLTNPPAAPRDEFIDELARLASSYRDDADAPPTAEPTSIRNYSTNK